MDSDLGYNERAKFEYTGVRTLRNLTVNQINSIEIDSGSSIYLIDNTEVHNIQICGYVVSCRTVPLGWVFEIDDTTGQLSCTFWSTNTAYDDITAEKIVENNLLKISGSLKIFNQQKTLNVMAVVPVTTNYLIYHFTSAIYQSLFYNHKIDRKKHLPQPKAAVVASDSEIPQIQSDALQVYRTNQDENGLELSIVISMLKSKYSENDIRDAVDALLTNCHLYSVDGESYKTVN